MQKEKIDLLVDNVADVVIESLKTIPGEAGVSADEVLERIKAKLVVADFTEKPNPVKILRASIKIGAAISSTTEGTGDDKFFAKGEQFVNALDPDGDGNIDNIDFVKGIFTSLFKKLKLQE